MRIFFIGWAKILGMSRYTRPTHWVIEAWRDWIGSGVGLLMGWIIFGVFGLGCYVELFGWEVMGLQDKWVEME